MQLVTTEIAKAIRRKRADLQLSKFDACEEIGITPLTLRRIENGNYEVKNTVFEKLTNWLAKDY